MNCDTFKNNLTNKQFAKKKSYTYTIYMYEQNLVSNNLQELISHKTQQTP